MMSEKTQQVHHELPYNMNLSDHSVEISLLLLCPTVGADEKNKKNPHYLIVSVNKLPYLLQE